jgi:cysteine desulfurase
MKNIYLDFNASTPMAPEVVSAMDPFLRGSFGNPSSLHWAGFPAKEAVDKARSQVAHLLGCSPEEIIFTSGGTESNNHAIKGVFFTGDNTEVHVITSQIEHPAVLEPCRFLQKRGAEITRIPVDSFGRVDPDDIRKAIRKNTVLVSIMHANNEVGTLQPIAEIAKITKDRGILFHTDAAQSVGKIPTLVQELGVDMLSLAGHKFHAPKGAGALYLRKGIRLEPLLHGSGHESGRRAGTENVLLDVGLGAACELSQQWIANDHVRDLKDRFWKMLQNAFGETVVFNGHPTDNLPNTLNVSFVGNSGAKGLAQSSSEGLKE